jgi:peptidoglycan/LPS O-acetylase OafA/YrhL
VLTPVTVLAVHPSQRRVHGQTVAHLPRHGAETGKLDLTQFYLRRMFRLVPAVVGVVAAVTIGSVLVWHDELTTLRGSALSGLGYVANWWLVDAQQSYFVSSGRPPMLQHLWSLAIEEQFYLVWPVVLLVFVAGPRWLKPLRFGRIAWVAFGLAIGSALLMGLIATRSGVPFAADSSRVYFGTDTHAMGLLLGATFGALAERAAFRQRKGWRVRTWPTDVLGCSALLALGILAFRVDQFMPGMYRGGFFGASALAVVTVATVSRRGSLLGRGLDVAPLRWLGDRSYSLYLWHWPVIVVTRPGVDLAMNHWLVLGLRVSLPLGLAWLSYRFLERPIGIIRPSDLAATLAALGDRQRVVLLTDRVPMDWQAPNNATIKRIAKDYRNVVVLDWYGLSNGNQGWFYADGLHLREPGAAKYASLVAKSLE